MTLPPPPAPSVQIARDAALSFKPLLRRWPNMRVLADDLALPYHTVASWLRRDSVDPGHWEAIAAAAKTRKLRGVTYAKFRAVAAARRVRPA